MTLTIDQLPTINVTAAFASRDDLDAIVMSAHEQGPFARSARGLEVLGHKECVVLLRDRRLHSDHMGLVEAMRFPEGPAKECKKCMLLSHGRDEYRTRIRQALTRAIGPSVIEKQRPMIRQLNQGSSAENRSGQRIRSAPWFRIFWFRPVCFVFGLAHR